MRNPDNINVLGRVRVLVLSLYQSPLPARGRRAPGLSPQLLRAAGSIQWNIAEGAALEDPAFAHHLHTAIASANETEHQLKLAYDLGLLGAKGDWYLTEIVEIRKMTIGLRKAVLRRVQLEG